MKVQSIGAAAFAALSFGLGLAGPAAADGKDTYTKQCSFCHQPSGQGAPGLYPPIADRLAPIAAEPEGRDYLANVVLYGLTGRIRVDGDTYSGLMPPFRRLSDTEVAEVLNYVVAELGAPPPDDFQPFLPEEIAKAREAEKTPQQVRQRRDAVLPEGQRQSDAAPADSKKAKADIPYITGVVEDYSRQCQGCHRADGLGAPPAVPRLAGFVGYYTRTPEGRAYLVQVPGVANAPLDDARLAAVLNWMLRTYSAEQLVPGFQPFTAEEVTRLRAQRLTAVVQTRRAVLAGLSAAGQIDPRLVEEALGQPAD